jgi:hypothetical protein
MTTHADRNTAHLAEDDATFVSDCWTALHYHNTDINPLEGPGLPPFAHEDDTMPTPLEAALVTALAHARLAQHILYNRTVDDEGNAIATSIFHGTRGIADVSHELWEQFTARVRSIHEAQYEARAQLDE